MLLAEPAPVLMFLRAASIDAALALDVRFDIAARWRVPVARTAYDAITRDELIDLLDGGDAMGEMRLACVGGRVSAQRSGDAPRDEIAVDRVRRGEGIGRALLDRAGYRSRSRGLGGLIRDTQDNSAGACRRYARHGFMPGGLDRRVYVNARPAAEIALYGRGPYAAGEGGA